MTATPPYGSRTLGGEPVGLEHLINSGLQLTGVLPVKSYPDHYTVLGGTESDVNPTVVPDRGAYVVASPSSGLPDVTGVAQAGNGLFDVYGVFAFNNRKTLWLTSLHFLTDVAWTVYLTSGLRDGVAGTTLDDPANDVAILRGTGSYFGSVGIEIPYGSCIRVVTDVAVGVDSRFGLRTTLTYSEAGRLIA